MKLPEIIIYDFDGVICDSVDIKTEAFVEIYKPYGERIQNAVKNYHLENGGISRYKKFWFFENQLLNRNVDEKYIENLANKFSSLVKRKVIDSDYIPGAINFLEKNISKKQFICTGTPQNEIEEIIREKKIESFFHGIYGSPLSKKKIINLILKKNNSNSENCIFFGDAMTDYLAANECNVPFVGLDSNKNVNFPYGTKK